VSSTKPRDDLSRGFVLEQFVGYLLGKRSWAELSDGLKTPERTLQERFSWCWDYTPPLVHTGEVYEVLVVDGTKVGGQSCLITSTVRHVVAWDFVLRENSTSWEFHFSRFPPPTVVVCDGQKGILLALTRIWPETRIQRCLVHVERNLRSKLTRNPESEAGRDILEHFSVVWDVSTAAQAGNWTQVFYEMYDYHSEFLKERSYSQTITSGRQSWWYTHRNVRSAYRQINRLIQDKQLFTYVDTLLVAQGYVVPRTSNRVEGGINSGLKGQLYIHRGMTSIHQQKIVEWFLYERSEWRKPPRFCV
jgi:hypothetical protein